MINKFKFLVFAFLGLATFAQPALAREFADIYTECGLGAMIAPRNEAVAAVTNVTWDLGTTAISSNISSPTTCKGGKEKMASFINTSFDSIEKDLASGSGAYLDTLALLSGIDQSSKDKFTQSLRSDFTDLVAASNYAQMSRYQKAEAFYNLVNKHANSV